MVTVLSFFPPLWLIPVTFLSDSYWCSLPCLGKCLWHSTAALLVGGCSHTALGWPKNRKESCEPVSASLERTGEGSRLLSSEQQKECHWNVGSSHQSDCFTRPTPKEKRALGSAACSGRPGACQNRTTMCSHSMRTSGLRKLIYLGTCYRHYLRMTCVYSL